MIKNIVCIGSGNMGPALMKGASSGTNIFFTDIDAEKAQVAANSLGAQVISTNVEAVKKADCVFLAVKPQVLDKVLAEISPVINERLSANSAPVLVSMAAGWSIEKIQTAIGTRVPVIRIMPNTPALIGKAMIAAASSPEVSEDTLKELEAILNSAGLVDRLEECYMNAATGLSGSGPAFVYLFIDALAEGGIRSGFPKEKALQYAVQTVIGAAAMVKETGKTPEELKNMVTSPGGTTLAGITALEKGAFRDTVIKAVEAAWKRAQELG
jgi:pyrroline-5-carboxylate reductase